jgi:hypothetical protein
MGSETSLCTPLFLPATFFGTSEYSMHLPRI